MKNDVNALGDFLLAKRAKIGYKLTIPHKE
jgi:hypothetical protein